MTKDQNPNMQNFLGLRLLNPSKRLGLLMLLPNLDKQSIKEKKDVCLLPRVLLEQSNLQQDIN
jgi:hypothetical protein